MMLENTAGIALATGAENHYIQLKLSEVLNPKPPDTRTDDEIIRNIKTKLEAL